MEIGVCTVMADALGEWPEYLGLMEKWGVRSVEVWDVAEHLPREPVGVMLLETLLHSRGMKAVSVHGPVGAERDPSSLDRATRERSLRDNISSLERTASLGAEFMVYHLSHKIEEEKERSERKKWAKDSLSQVDRRAESLGVRLAVENLLQGYLGWNAEELQEVVGPFLGKTAGICFDTGHVQVSGLNLDMVDSLRGNIISFHLSDNNGTEDQHLFPGQGKVDWAALGRKLAEIGYCGRLMLECHFPGEADIVQKVKDLLGI